MKKAFQLEEIFPPEVITKLANEIQQHGWDKNLHALYQWPLAGQLESLMGKCDPVPAWLDELSIGAQDSDKSETFSMTLTLRENIPAMLKVDGEQADEIKTWIVRDWGGIQRGDEEGLQACILQAEDEHQCAFKPTTRNKSGKREFTFDRVASWSKYLAFKYPDQYAIYDARVIYSLNWLLRNTGAKKYLPFLDGQNSVMGLLNYNMHLLLAHHGKQKLLDRLKVDIKSREDNPGMKSRLRSDLEKGLFVRKQEAYSEYCDLLRELAGIIYPDDKKHGLTKIEMILFSVADKAIALMVMDSLTGKHLVVDC